MIHEAWDTNANGEIDAINRRIVWESWRALKPGGWLFLTCSNTNKGKLYELLGWDTKARVSDERFRFINEVTWFKPNAVPFVQAKQLRRAAPSCEYLLIFGKGIPSTYNYEWLKTDRTDYEELLVDQSRKKQTGKEPQMRDFWVIDGEEPAFGDNAPWVISQDTKSYTPFAKDDKGRWYRHKAQKPNRLLERIIKGYTDPGQSVLDPCSGSGTTGAAAISEGRDYIGFERESLWADLQRQRLEQIGPGRYITSAGLMEHAA
jgi:DNA modification methylase